MTATLPLSSARTLADGAALLGETPALETERLTLRVPQEGDFEAWAEFMASDRARFIGGPLDRGRAWRSFATMLGHWILHGTGPFVFARRESGCALGSTGPWFPAGWPEREIGWTVWRAEVEGQGYAGEAARAALDHAFRELRWPTAVSYIEPGNVRSIALAERLGARRDPEAAHPGEAPLLVYRHEPRSAG